MAQFNLGSALAGTRTKAARRARHQSSAACACANFIVRRDIDLPDREINTAARLCATMNNVRELSAVGTLI
jgi:hypothetical protein